MGARTSRKLKQSLVKSVARQASKRNAKRRCGKRHVLLVEPDDDLCLFLRFAISGLGRRVTIAGSRAEAKEILGGEEPVDVAVTNMNLPDGSGLSLACEAVRKARRTFLLRSFRGRIEVANEHGVVFRGERSAVGAFLSKVIS